MEHCPTVAAYTSFSNTHVIFSQRDHILSHKTKLDKLKIIQMMQGIFLGYQLTERYLENPQLCEN